MPSAFQQQANMQALLIITALIAVYIVLGVLYESLAHPITIISTLPSAGLGALVALRLAGMELTVIAFIGIILLIGIVKKNGIMLVDFALEAERERGLSPLRAIHEACIERFRPIMMTTFAALLGAIPLAIAVGPGSELRRPLGIAIIGGLIVSQVLTLYTTPVIYLMLDRLHRRLWGSRSVRGAEPACHAGRCLTGHSSDRINATPVRQFVVESAVDDSNRASRTLSAGTATRSRQARASQAPAGGNQGLLHPPGSVRAGAGRPLDRQFGHRRRLVGALGGAGLGHRRRGARPRRVRPRPARGRRMGGAQGASSCTSNSRLKLS